jgi:hypothetical protein
MCDIIPDKDEYINIEYAIKQSNIIKPLKNFDLSDFINILIAYDALIDISGLFKNYKNFDIAKEINKITKKNVIFIDENDIKFIYNDNNTIDSYNEFIKYNNIFIYYSQSHTIGIDINQDYYPSLKGLCTLDKTTTYKDVAQGMYRLRKLNIGHSINFYVDNIDNNEQLLERLISKKIIN